MPHARHSDPDTSHVVVDDASGCWNWQRSTNNYGYGNLCYEGRTQTTHRLIFAAAYGYSPKTLHHLCENRRCCNPEHLVPIDRGENCRLGKNAKLDWPRVHRIRELYAAGGCTMQELADAYETTTSNISHIINRKRWVPTAEAVEAGATRPKIAAHRSAPAGRPLSPTLPSPLPGDGWGRWGV